MKQDGSQSEHQFDLFFENSIDLLCIADANGVFIKLNPEWEATLGYKLSELEGHPFVEFVHPDDVAQTVEATAHLAANEKITNFTNRYRCKDGSYRWIEWRSYPANNMIYASARDITDRKNSEDALRMSEQKYRLLFENMTSAFMLHQVIYDDNGKPVDYRFLEANPAFEKLTGHSSSNIVGKTFREIAYQSSETWIKRMGDVAMTGKAIQYVEYNKEMGKWFDSFIYRPKPNHLAVMFNDITEKKRADGALRDSEQKYRLLFENMTSGFALHQMIYDENGNPADYRYVEANPAFEKLTGVPVSSLIGHTVKELMPDTEAHWINTFGNVAKNGEPIRYINYAKEIGRYFDTFSFSPEKDKFAVVFNDVSEAVKAENALRESEANFRKIVNSIPIALGISDLNGNIKFNNNAFYRCFGYEPDDIPNIEAWLRLAFPDPEYREKVLALWADDIRAIQNSSTAKTFTREFAISTKSGKTLQTEISSSIIEDEIYILFNDVTESRAAQKELEETKAALTTALMQTPIPMAIISMPDKIIRVMNDACLKFLKIEDEPSRIGKSVLELNPTWVDYHEDGTPMQLHETPIAQALQGIETTGHEFYTKRKDGSICWGNITTSVVRNNKGETIAVYLVFPETTQQKLMVEALKESESNYRDIFNATSDALVIQEIQGGHIVDVNNSMLRMFGFQTKDEVLSTTLFNVCADVNSYTINGLRDKINQVIEGKPQVFEWLVRTRPGQLIWVEISMSITTIAGIKRIIASIRDINQRKEAELELLKSQTVLKATMESMSDGVLVVSDEGKVTHFNSRFRDVFAIPDSIIQSQEDVVLLNFAKNRLADPDTFFSQVQEIYRCHVPTEDVLIMGNGNILERLSFPLKKGSPIKGRVWFFRDITEKRHAQEILRQKDEKLKGIFLTAPVAIGLVEEGRYTECNELFYAMSGYNPEEVVGHPVLLPGLLDAIALVRKKIEQNGTLPEPIRVECPLKKKNGEVIDVLMQLMATTNDRSNIGIIFTMLDVTLQKKAAREIAELNNELEKRVNERTLQYEKANKDLEAFAYSISHDLRGPIRHIDGFLKLMYNGLKEPSATTTNHYNKVISAAKRLGEMVEELLAFSRLGRKELTVVPVDLRQMIDDIVESMKPDYLNRDIEWNIGSLPVVKGDQALLQMAFENLISNAIKYTRYRDKAIIEMGVKEITDNQTTLFIKDNGAGFDMAYSDKLFGVFQRLHSNEEFEGIGIGLANVKQIILRHQGAITAESELDKGACFYVTLPV
jgi:PAS domain S-box-containing protein